jgi:ribonuclease BN (tRNA processing enzyme)
VTGFRIIGLLIVLAVVIASWMLTWAAGRYDDVTAGFLPLEPRSFERMTVLTLGTGGTQEDHNRRGPATALAVDDTLVLVDAGRGAADSLRAARIPASQPGTVLLTSLLPENTVGLDDLLAMGWNAGRREPVRLVGPPGTGELARAVLEGARPGIEARARGLGLETGDIGFTVVEIGDGWRARLGPLEVRAGGLPDGPTPAFAYRFSWRDRSAVVGGAGWSPDALVALADGANLLVHEAVFVPTPEMVEELALEADPELLRREAALHTTLDAVGELARRARVGSLVLVRLRPPPVFALQITSVVDDTYDGRIAVAGDGDEFTP